MCANVGTIIGPILGGLLADPAANYPSLFGGITFLEEYPYAPPNLLSAIFLCSAAFAAFFGLEEVSNPFAQCSKSIGLHVWCAIANLRNRLWTLYLIRRILA